MKRLLSFFVNYAEPQSRSDCFAARRGVAASLRYAACSDIIQGVELVTSVKIHQLVSHRLLQISERSLT